MKVRNWPLVMISICIFIITGCSTGLENEEQRIEVQKDIGDNEYEDFKVVTDNNEVMQVKKILKDTTFENKKVQMSRPADYHFIFQFKNPKIEAKAVLYQIWVIPNKDKIEIIAGNSQYVQLEGKNAATLFQIVTGEKLVE
ncbi:hypothetical protein ACQVQT_15575 [Bacillus paranthracis]|uniref:Lipoprotein n=3 Tax=Bacillus cereus group TaxID=86661 RepID=A0A5M9GLK4_9BACI|nr:MULTISPECIES: hypothetical protein [Bacillus]ACJ78990.1 putative lipoprotein [Bacillus cereus AH187]ACM13470.1 lipoprotein, putative [Bacillus cereus Q1]EDZ58475.1 putative lipoprotein [Bacillus cereus H3081.97]EJP98672.1 hypothetical protein IAU_01013 [Bacillus cereus IS075]EJQ05313.1 hypothetical protein IC5_02140 [Bacillus cereus AND1407]EJR18989.1 hypothetical protein II7_01094 [Bacillus cereus MSX-A12]EOO88227.1 hypothetical protein IGS_03248 [Bacillus cereus IS845/00]EOO96388.1 hyp